jgi:WD40 repeat protein
MTAHLRRHREREKQEAAEQRDNLVDSLVGPSPSGRKQRRAAVKAGSKVAEAIGILKANEDGTVGDTDDDPLEGEDAADEMYSATKDFNLKEHYSKKKGKAICKFCRATFANRKDIESHIITEHDQELQEEEDDDDEGVDEDEDFDEGDAGSDEEGQWRIGRRRSAFSGRGPSQPFLDPTTSAIKQENDYREANYEKNAFQEFHTRFDDWRKLDEEEALPYLPTNSHSCSYRSRSCSSSTSQESRVLERFSSHIDNSHTVSFFAGGPVWAASWCPMSEDGDAAYVAVSAHADQDEARLKESQVGKGLLQIWRLDKKSLQMKMVLGVAHSFGKMRSLAWAPSGNQHARELHLDRLGLVACSCSDGTVRLFSIPRPEAILGETLESGIFHAKPVLSLRLNREECPTSACLRVAWFRGARHRVVAGGFADGLVALWDLEHPKGGVQRVDADLYPFARVLAHNSSVTGLALSDHAATDDPSFPHTLATGSSDRTISIWNLENADASSATPSRSIKRGLVSDLAWMHHYPGHVAAAFDDVYLQGHSQTLVFDLARDQTTPMGAQNSVVWSLSLNPWVNVLMTVTSAGELTAFLAQALDKSLDDKYATRRRVYIYRTETATSEENSGEKTLCFVDVPVHDLKSVPEEEQRLSRAAVSMAQEDLSRGGLASINRVDQNIDLHSLGWTLTGGQAGVCRVINVSHLQSQAVKKEIKSLNTCL